MDFILFQKSLETFKQASNIIESSFKMVTLAEFPENGFKKYKEKMESETVGYCCLSDDGGQSGSIRCDVVEGTINTRKAGSTD